MKFSPRHAASAAVLALLAACGGGGTQVDPFEPRRLLAFGDENSLLTPNGQRYAVNALQTENNQTVVDCSANPIWLQTVANGFGLVLAACNPGNQSISSAVYAQPGSKVADLKAQIDQHFATSSVNSRDLITLYVGLHDILELYTQFPALAEAQLLAAAGARGKALAEQANRLATANGRVLVLTLPSVGVTPFAITEKASRPDVDRQALLRSLSGEFNRQLRLNLLNDGRLIGLVLADELIDSMAEFPAAYGLTNVSLPACTVALPNCNTGTLALDATAATWLWADNLRFSAQAHTNIGNAALTRAARNPF